MMVEWCPVCKQRIVRARMNTDLVHECHSGNAAIDQEDVLIIGDFVDYTGSGTYHKFSVMSAGLQDELQGTQAGARGKERHEKTVRGNKAALYRQRQRLTYMDFRGR